MKQTDELHENGPWKTDHGAFINKWNPNSCTNNPASYLDMNTGTMLKQGDADMIKSYAATHIHSLIRIGCQSEADGLTVIEYNRLPNAKLDADEICTLMNYMGNTLPAATIKKLLSSDEPELKQEIARTATDRILTHERGDTMTHIHIHIEVKKGGKWLHYAAPEVHTNEILFAAINGNGLEHLRIRDRITPQASIHSLPPDISEVTAICYEQDAAKYDIYEEGALTSRDIKSLQKHMIAVTQPLGTVDYDLEVSIFHLFINDRRIAVHEGWDDSRIVFWYDDHIDY